MDSYLISWKPSAVKELRKLPRTIVPRIISAVELLSQNPYPSGTRKLAGAEHTFRIRIGDYRVIYTIEDEVLVVEILRVGHRSDVYR